MRERLRQKRRRHLPCRSLIPALRATFSPAGEGGAASGHRDRNFGRGAHGVAVGADDVGGGGELFSLGLIQAGDIDGERHVDAEARSVFTRADADLGGNRRVFRKS